VPKAKPARRWVLAALTFVLCLSRLFAHVTGRSHSELVALGCDPRDVTGFSGSAGTGQAGRPREPALLIPTGNFPGKVVYRVLGPDKGAISPESVSLILAQDAQSRGSTGASSSANSKGLSKNHLTQTRRGDCDQRDSNSAITTRMIAVAEITGNTQDQV
jgi:hypothetical protein